ncbi:MAG: hypothetical protein WBD40_22780 [Tepidisphaeraceae bacterium]
MMLVACAVFSAGCGPRVTKKPLRWYDGPTESMTDVVSRINANNERLPTLWMRHAFAAVIIEQAKDGKKRTTNVDGRGVIMYQAPNNLFMNGSHALGTRMFELGCNAQEYWLGVPYEKVDTIWHGRMEHLGKPCIQPIPMRPDLLMEVLGVFTIDPNFARFPAPVMKFNNDEDVYMFTWIQPQLDRFVAIKEVWYDRKTLRPRLVNLFGQDGRILLRAYLSQHRPVDLEGVEKDQRPQVPGKYDLLFTENGARMTIEVEDARLSNKGAPDARAFRRPNLDNYANQNQLDEACGD